MKARLFNPFTSALFVSGILLFAVFALSSIQTRAAPAVQESVAQQEALQAISLASTEAYTLTLTGPSEGFVNEELNFTVAITPDSHDVYTVEVDFGDGETTEYEIEQGDDTVNATHAYDKPGNVTVQATMHMTDTEVAVSNELAVSVQSEAASNVEMTLAAAPTTIEPSDCVTVTAVITPLIDFDTYKAEELRLDFGNGYSPTLPISSPYAKNTPQSTMVISKYCGYNAEGTYTVMGEYYSSIYGGKVASDETSVTVEETEEPEPEPEPGPLNTMTVAVSPEEAQLPESHKDAGMSTISALFWDENENFWQPHAEDPMDVTFATDFGTFTSTVTVDKPTMTSMIVTDTGQTIASAKLYSKVKGTATVTATYTAANGKVYSGTKEVKFVRTEVQDPNVGEHMFTPGGTAPITLEVSEVGSLVIPVDLHNDPVTLKVSKIDTATDIDTTSLPTETIKVIGAFIVELFKTNGIQITDAGNFGSPLKLVYPVGDDEAEAPFATKIWQDGEWVDVTTTHEEDAAAITLQAATVTSELPSIGTYVKTGATVEAGPPIVYLPLIMRLEIEDTEPVTDTDDITPTLQLAW